MDTTTYSDVTAMDTDVAAFIVEHRYAINLLAMPLKMWVARQGGRVVGVLLLNPTPYLALDLVLADRTQRPFMRIIKLWRLAERWLVANNVPIVCVSIHDQQAHFQSLVRRLGFVEVGEEPNLYGERVETIFAKTFPVTAYQPELTVH